MDRVIASDEGTLDTFDLDFAILCHQRSGSHLIQTCLNSHPDIYCFGELGFAKELDPPAECRVVGAIIMYNQWDRLDGQVRIQRFLHLVRNPRDTALSLARNERDKALRGSTHRAHYRKGEELPPAYEVSAEEVRSWQERVERYQARFKDTLAKRKTLTLTYESLTNNSSVEQLPEREGRRILAFLGVPYYPLSTTLVKSGPSDG